MATAAITGYRTIFKIITATSAPVAIAEITNVDGPSMDAATADVTSHGIAASTDPGWREKIVTLLDGGQISGTLNFLASVDKGAQKLAGLYAAGKLCNCAILWPDGTEEWTFDGFVTHFEPHGPVDGASTADFTIEVTGAVTY